MKTSLALAFASVAAFSAFYIPDPISISATVFFSLVSIIVVLPSW